MHFFNIFFGDKENKELIACAHPNYNEWKLLTWEKKKKKRRASVHAHAQWLV